MRWALPGRVDEPPMLRPGTNNPTGFRTLADSTLKSRVPAV